MLRKRGTAVIVGIAPIGDTAAIEPVVLTRGEKTITGTYYGSAHPRQDMPRIADWVERGRIDVAGLVTRRYAPGRHQPRVRGSSRPTRSAAA